MLVLVLALQGMGLLAAGRAYIAGESLWSKGQMDAVFYLQRYALERGEADFVAYERAIAVPLGDREARLEMDKPVPNLARVREGFLQGGNHPDDIDGLIRLYRHLGDVGPIAQAIGIWAEADRSIMESPRSARRCARPCSPARSMTIRSRRTLTRSGASTPG